MAVRKFKPVTPGQRNKVISAFDDITAKKPQKSLIEPLKSTGGRNNTGQMTGRYTWPGRSSILCTRVPTGISARGRALPTSGAMPLPEAIT